MLKNVIFYNQAHLGDVFMSRGLVATVMRLVKAENYIYDHHFSSKTDKVLRDIPNLKQQSKGICVKPRAERWKFDGQNLFVNTGYMVHTEYWQNEGTTFQCLMKATKGELKRELKIDANITVQDMVSKINYNVFEIKKASEFLSANLTKRKVFIANNDTLSGQSTNYNMDPAILELSAKYPQISFIVSNHTGRISSPNVYYSNNILGISSDNLMENAFLAKACEIILGRGSGPATFCLNFDNLYGNKNKIIGVCLCREAVVAGMDRVLPNKFLFSSTEATKEVVRLVSGELDRRK